MLHIKADSETYPFIDFTFEVWVLEVVVVFSQVVGHNMSWNCGHPIHTASFTLYHSDPVIWNR